MNDHAFIPLIEQLQTYCFGDLLDTKNAHFCQIEAKVQQLSAKFPSSQHGLFAHVLVNFCKFERQYCFTHIRKIHRSSIDTRFHFLFDTLEKILYVLTDCQTDESLIAAINDFNTWKQHVPVEYAVLLCNNLLVTLRKVVNLRALLDILINDALELVNNCHHPVSVFGFYFIASVTVQINYNLETTMDILLHGLDRAQTYHFINYESGFLSMIAYVYEHAQLENEAFKYYQQIVDNPDFDHINDTSHSIALINAAKSAITLGYEKRAYIYLQQVWPLIHKANLQTELTIIAKKLEIRIELQKKNACFTTLWSRFQTIVHEYIAIREHFHLLQIDRDLLLLEADLLAIAPLNNITCAQRQLAVYQSYQTYAQLQNTDSLYERTQICKKIAHCFQKLNDEKQALQSFRSYELLLNDWSSIQRSSHVHRIHKQFEAKLQKTKVIRLHNEKQLLQTQYRHDTLTHLYSRHYLNELLAQNYTPNGYILIDVDYFKCYNDTFGHLEGDRVLRQIAEIIQYSLEPSEYAFRFGGEEFLILLSEQNEYRIREISKTIQTQLKQLAIEFPNPRTNYVTVSMGCLWLDAYHYSFEHAFDQVDTLLYQSKLSGRNMITHRIFSHDSEVLT